VRDYCGGFRTGAAAGIRNRHDHGSQYMGLATMGAHRG